MTIATLKNKLFSIYLSNRTEGKKRYLFILELITIFGVYLIAFGLWRKFFNPLMHLNKEVIYLGVFNILSWILLYRLTIIAKLPRTQRYRQIFFNIVRVGFLELIILFITKLALGYSNIDNLFILFYASLNLFVLFHVKIFTFRIFKIFRAKGYDLHQVVVIADSYSDSFIEKIIGEKEWGFKISRIFTNSKLIREKYGSIIPIYPENENISDLLLENVVDEVIYCKYNIDAPQIREITTICNEIGVIFRLQSGLSPLEDMKIHLNTLNDESQLSLSDSPSFSISLFFKYVTDLYFSFFMLILLFPVFLAIGIAIKIDSRGPVFFAQERVGLRGRRFKLYKFRTMISNAEHALESLKNKNEVDGPVFKIKKDPRITRIGAFLRKTGLDELPQLYNVFKGQMSLIGPRPPLANEVAQYKRWQLRRLSVKPGISCSWQVIPNRNEVNFEKWMKLDLQYIDNWNFGKDMLILAQTIRTFFTAGGH